MPKAFNEDLDEVSSPVKARKINDDLEEDKFEEKVKESSSDASVRDEESDSSISDEDEVKDWEESKAETRVTAAKSDSSFDL